MESSPLDKQIQQTLWSAVIPIELRLAPDDLATQVPPDPYYILAPRIGYLPSATEIAESYFMEFVSSRFDGMWFMCGGVPLKWNLPVGVLYDLYGQGELPWQIQVNFQNFPADRLQRWEGEAALKHHFINNLKEANHLKDKSNQAINSLSKEEQTTLWDSVKAQDYTAFWKVYPKLCKGEDEIKFVPVRVVTEDSLVMMSPITTRRDDGGLTLLGDVLARFSCDPTQKQVLVHGVTPSLDTPIVWLAYHCCHPDNFVYISVVSPRLP